MKISFSICSKIFLFLIPVISMFSIIGFSTKSIFNKPLFIDKLTLLKKFVSYNFFKVLFKSFSS